MNLFEFKTNFSNFSVNFESGKIEFNVWADPSMNTNKKSEVVNPGAASARDEVFGTRVILGEILKHMNIDELKICTVVSKQWNKIVRSYMQDFRNILASCKNKRYEKCSSPPCAQLKLLNQALTEWTPSSVIPFRGIIINLEHENEQVETSSSVPKCEDDIDANFSKIIKSIPLHRLVVKFTDGNPRMPDSCPIISYLRRWVPIQDEVIEELELINMPFAICQEFKKMGVLDMRALKTLKLSLAFSDRTLEGRLLTTFCTNAPKLKRLQAPVDHESLPLLPLSLHKSIEGFELNEITSRSMEKSLLLFAKHQPALRHLYIAIISAEAEYFPGFKLVCQQIVKSSQSTLESLCVEILDEPSFLAVFKDIFVDPVPTLRYLGFNIGEEADWLPMLEDFDFRLFPCLEHIRIFDYIDYDPVGSDYITVPYRSPALSVTWLHLELVLADIEVAYFQRIFPNVTKLHYDCHWVGSPFADIWAHWPDLEELVINMNFEWSVICDAEICGIFQEEVDFLREQSTEYLLAVHIVPVQPALTTMSKMKILQMEFYNSGTMMPSTGIELFSSVTCHVAFGRMSNLSVTVNCEESDDFSALEHLKGHILLTNKMSKFGK